MFERGLICASLRQWRDWPGRKQREPSRRDPDYLAHKHLVCSLGRAVDQNLKGRRSLLLIDVGAGEKPYYPLFAPYVSKYIGVDIIPGSNTDVQGKAEKLPFRGEIADVVLATQVFEHLDDPRMTIREFRRVLRVHGLAFVSTHGTFIYHPIPVDYWRWTHTGLRKLFEQEGFHIRSIEPCGGGVSALMTLVAFPAIWYAQRFRLRGAMQLLLVLLNSLVERLDEPAALSDNLFGNIPTNYLVVAENR